MFIFVSSSSDDVNALLTTFDALASDHYYMVRRTVACGIHEVRLSMLCSLNYSNIVFIYNKPIICR